MSTLQSARFFTRLTTAAVLLASVGLPALARAQSKPSLATVAREESERRKTSKEAKKVITAKDLPESAQRPAAASPSPAASGAAAQATADGASAGAPASDPAAGPAQKNAPAADDAQGEAYWHTRMTAARENLRRTQVIYDALQARLGGLTADYNQSDLFERNKYLDARQNTAEESDRIKKEIEQLKKAIADTEEDARKAGVPPGWLR